MRYCPKCRSEYENGYNTCTDCGSALVDEIPLIPEYDLSEAAFLTSVADEIHADMIEAELKSNEIPVLKKYKEAGAYLEIYMGMTSFGIDLYVPLDKLNEAKELLEKFDVQGIVKEEDTELFEENRNYIKMRMIRAWIILLFILPGVIFLLFFIFEFISSGI
jgi:hypothetical protein